jgi:uncharacterized membrane protein
MEKDTDKIDKLKDRLDALADKHRLLAEEMASLTREIKQLKAASEEVPEPESTVTPEKTGPDVEKAEPVTTPEKPTWNVPAVESPPVEPAPTPQQDKNRFSLLQNLNLDLEEFIGSNLISKIGVGAIVIGMGIGIKYAIDNDLISPLVRILMGFLVGAILLFFSYRLRKEYKVFGAVLFSGATVLMFFTSYAAHSYYAFLSQALAFGIMVALTVYVVAEALRFDEPVVAHIGLVGAYAVPFLLGDNPDAITFLFTYIAIVNLGILVIAFLRYWKSLYYAAFAFTWLIYSSWYLLDYRPSAHFGQALMFLAVFFGIFYLAFLAYKLVRHEKYELFDVVMLLLNSFFFYGLGYLILQDHETGQHRLGLFTLINALIHLGVSALIWSFRPADRNLFYLVSGIGLIFTMIAVPVQLDGNWVTLLWASEAALLFWIGRTRAAPVYEGLAYVLFVLAFVSLVQDWDAYNVGSKQQIAPVFNIYLLTTLWSAGCFGFSIRVNNQTQYRHPLQEGSLGRQLLDYSLTLFFLLTLYLGFQLEIAHYFDQLKAGAPGGNDLSSFEVIWHINFSLFFLSVLALVNTFRFRNQVLAQTTLVLNLIFLLLFLSVALPEFHALQEVYLAPPANHHIGNWHVGIRYVSYLFAGGLLWTTFQLIKQPFVEMNIRVAYDLLLHITLLSVASLELLCWMKTLNAFDSFQAGLSILWGIYTLALITLGIRWSQKHLRIAAMVLIGITLGKVVLIDLADLDTLTKTLVLVTLGALLLVISFLYNKFRAKLFQDRTDTG